ncbi:MAG: hypothetical protein H6825_08090 [Planctomycetes bacterium]|nr:hypothetical protein [Planctomycetota bacterium]
MPFARILPAAALFATLVSPATARDEAPPPDGRVLVRLADVDRATLVDLVQRGIDVASVHGDVVTAWVTPDEAAELTADGRSVIALPRPGGTPDALAGYPTYTDLSNELAALAAAHPDLCRLVDAGRSVQGRHLWMLRISDDPDLEQDEPEFRFVSTIHGNEPVGMVTCLDLAHLLLESYGSDPDVTQLVDECELWIMPLMNPDGYVAQTRYNAHGVDLNRDFPDRVTDPLNTTAGREPETQALMEFGFTHSPVLSANFHTGSLVVNYPYDSDPNPFASYSATPDDALIASQSLTYASLNPPMSASPYFANGITNGVAWYTVYGGMQDWNYVWQGCTDLTIELSDTYWPSASALPGLWDDNRDAMLAYMARCLEGARGLATDAVDGQPVAATVRVLGNTHLTYADPDVGDWHRLLLPGTYAIEISAVGYATVVESNVVVGAGPATRRDTALVPTGYVDLGGALAGLGGTTPALAGAGPLSGGSANAFVLTDARASSVAHLVLGVAQFGAPFKGGTLVPSPDLVLFGLPVDAGGALTIPFVMPPGLPSGASVYAQLWVVDAAGPAGFAASNGLRATTP